MEKKSNDKSVRWICGILFASFAFSWLFFFQRELIWAENAEIFSAASFRVPAWLCHHHLVVSLFLTALSLLLAIPGRLLMRFRKGLYACNYLFSAAFLGIITGYDEESLLGQTYVQWIVAGAFMLVLFLVCKIVASVPKSDYNDRPRTLAGNLLIMSLLFCMTGYLGNTDENLHRRLKMEYLYFRFQYDDVLQVGRYEEESDPGIDLLRAKSMLWLPVNDAPEGSGIGDMLFKYSISDPDSLANSLKRINNTQAYLSACLLCRDIESFRDSIRLSDYKVLPRYYMQAMVIANDSLAAARFPQQFKDELECYESFRSKLESLESEPKQFQANSTFINFHETYFWFLKFGK